MTKKTTFLPSVLPYYNVLRGERGWQFALPGNPTKSGGVGPPNLLLLLEDGNSRRLRGPLVTPPDLRTGRPGTPMWAWVAAETPDNFEDLPDVSAPTGSGYYRALPPVAGAGRCPLVPQTLPARPVPNGRGGYDPVHLFVTPAGAEFFTAAAAALGLPFPAVQADQVRDLEFPLGDHPGMLETQTFGAGSTQVVKVWSRDGFVLGYEPTRWTAENGLWSTHIVAFTAAIISTLKR